MTHPLLFKAPAPLRPPAVLPPGAPLSGLRSLSLPELLFLKIPPRKLLLAPWLPEKGSALLFSPPGVGKTHFALGAAIAVATGTSYLGFEAPEPRRVLFLDGEMPASTLQDRLRSNMRGCSDELATNLRILAADLCEGDFPDLGTEAGLDAIARETEWADLIILDNLSTLCRSGKENEAESWVTMQLWALRQRREGRSILFVHHAGKSGEQRGTSKRADAVDTVIRLTRPDDYCSADGARFIVSFDKSRGFFGPEAEPFIASYSDGRWSTEPLGNKRAVAARELHDQGMNQRQIAERLNVSAATINRDLKVMASEPAVAPETAHETAVKR